MTSETRMGNVQRAQGSGLFQDGDTLVMAAPATMDLSLYTTVRHFMQDDGSGVIRQILLDLSGAKTLCASGIAALQSLDRLAAERSIRLLMLDPPPAIRRRLDSLIGCSLPLYSHHAKSVTE